MQKLDELDLPYLAMENPEFAANPLPHFAKARADPDVIAGETDNAGADGLAVREISLVGGAMDRVDFHGRRNIESGLLESERHASRASEEVYSNRSCHH